tara:strand:+ start:658 stop:963 length:306 start_codon:yes stop_codon:yes gene_type:complete
MATQTIVMTKAGSSWSTSEEAKVELLEDINNTAFTSNFINDFSPPPEEGEETTLDGQTLQIVRSWTTMEAYNEYKTRLGANDDEITDALIAQGWTHTESVE